MDRHKNDISDEIKKLNDEKNRIEMKIKKLIDKKNKIDRQLSNDNDKKYNKIDIQKNMTKDQIILLFEKNVKGKIYVKNNDDHCGEEGQWLEKLMNLKINSNNSPDIGGYEMKKDSKKISFGDWSGEYLFSQKRELIDDMNDEKIMLTKEKFIKYFGNKNEEKDRYSWSGSCVPKYNEWNNCGQMLKIDEHNNILAMYAYDLDKRKAKTTPEWKNREICIAVWNNKKMENHVNNKFNQKGFFICKKDKNNKYNKICFGMPINFKLFIKKIKTGDIFFDSGMYYDEHKPNNRLYSHWRAGQKFWDNLLIE